MVVVFDLDDTLFPEMDFVRSAYCRIAKLYGRDLLPAMTEAASPRDAFDSTGLPAEGVIGVYRSHFPDIRLPWQSFYTLVSLRKSGCILGLITDGRSLTQRNKIKALGLERFMRSDLIMVSEEVGSDKLSGEAFRRIMSQTGGQGPYVYVGDNPVKDFVAANRLGWLTVCYRRGGCGENISKIVPDSVSFENRAVVEVENLIDLLYLVDNMMA